MKLDWEHSNFYIGDPGETDISKMSPLKGISEIKEVFDGAMTLELYKPFEDMVETFTNATVTFNFAVESAAAELLWLLFGYNKRYVKDQQLFAHREKKRLRALTREDPKRSKMHAEYRRRQKNRRKRK